MRIRLTDGTHEVEIAAKGDSPKQLDDAKNAALHMLDALRAKQPTERGTTFGFTSDVALDSNTERAEVYTEPGREGYEDEEALP